jgi:hypothetical protein
MSAPRGGPSAEKDALPRINQTATVTGTVRTIETLFPDGHYRITLDVDISRPPVARPYCVRCEVPIYQGRHGVWRREATGADYCPRNPAGDGHEPRILPPAAPCAMCGGMGKVYDGPRVTWKPCSMCPLPPANGRDA